VYRPTLYAKIRRHQIEDGRTHRGGNGLPLERQTQHGPDGAAISS
jgi:hypothetical protein